MDIGRPPSAGPQDQRQHCERTSGDQCRCQLVADKVLGSTNGLRRPGSRRQVGDPAVEQVEPDRHPCGERRSYDKTNYCHDSGASYLAIWGAVGDSCVSWWRRIRRFDGRVPLPRDLLAPQRWKKRRVDRLACAGLKTLLRVDRDRRLLALEFDRSVHRVRLGLFWHGSRYRLGPRGRHDRSHRLEVFRRWRCWGRRAWRSRSVERDRRAAAATDQLDLELLGDVGALGDFEPLGDFGGKRLLESAEVRGSRGVCGRRPATSTEAPFGGQRSLAVLTGRR